MSVVDEIKDRIDIVDIISETVRLRRTGSSYSGFCPFHDNTRTPAFSVFPDTGTWHCFGCGEGGDAFSFIMKKESWDFRETLEYLSQRTGVELKKQTPVQQEQQEQFVHQRQLLDECVLFYQHYLLNTPEGEEAHQYFTKRGVKRQTIEKFGLGFSPNQWNACMNHFLESGYSMDDLLAVGLVTTNQEKQTQYDRFRNRIMFPIRDARGKMTGFGARTLEPEGLPKYLNSPQTGLYNKSNLLFGLDLARKAIREQDQVVIVEGYLDVIIPHQAGYTNLVSPMGTALSAYQFRSLKKLTQHIVLALDPDAAGEKATLRGLDVARQTMDRETEVVFDARGLLHQEARLQADIRVCQLPDGLDPDEIILRDPEEWGLLVSNAKPIVLHVMETLVKNKDINDPKIKGQIADQVLPIIDDVVNPVEREDYRQRLARLLKVDERSLLRVFTPPASSSRQFGIRSRPQISQEPGPTIQKSPVIDITKDLEFHILRLLLRAPEMINTLDRWLQSFDLTRFQTDDFHIISHQIIADTIKDAMIQDKIDPDDYISKTVSSPADEILTAMTNPIAEGEPTPRQLRENLIRSFVRLRMIYTSRRMDQLHFMLQESDQNEIQDDLRIQIVNETQHKAKLDKAFHKPLFIP